MDGVGVSAAHENLPKPSEAPAYVRIGVSVRFVTVRRGRLSNPRPYPAAPRGTSHAARAVPTRASPPRNRCASAG